ncbi:MAG: hypothetical protein HY962_07225 [Ignavibacteriae bacterium]|nr:hypothetical protein [Ignavibacteriota bacterium]
MTISERDATDKVRDFLNAWRLRDWAAMARTIQLTPASHHGGRLADYLRTWFSPRMLVSYSIEDTVIFSDCMMEIRVLIKYLHPGTPGRRVELRVNTICELAPYTPAGGEVPGGVWGVNPASALREYVVT